MIHSSPSRSARVCRLARSLPAPGSLNSCDADDVAPVQLRQVPLLHLRLGVGQDRRRHHAEADAEEALLGHVVLRFGLGVHAFVGAGQLAAAELGRARRSSRGRRRSAWPATPEPGGVPRAPCPGRPARRGRRRRCPRPRRTSSRLIPLPCARRWRRGKRSTSCWNSSSVGVSAMSGVPLRASERT